MSSGNVCCGVLEWGGSTAHTARVNVDELFCLHGSCVVPGRVLRQHDAMETVSEQPKSPCSSSYVAKRLEPAKRRHAQFSAPTITAD